MGLKKAENQMKLLLQETITALCRNTLHYYAEVTVEGLLGITLNSEEIFLVSINENFNNPDVVQKTKANLKRSKKTADTSGSDSNSEQSDGENDASPSKRKRKRHRKKKKKPRESEDTGDDSDANDDGHGNTNANNDTGQHNARPTQDNGDSDQANDSKQVHTPGHDRNVENDTIEQKDIDDDDENLQNIKIKEEAQDDEDDDEDLVFVKEEIGDSSMTYNQYSNYSSEGHLFMQHGAMGQGGLMHMPGQPGVSGSSQYSQEFMGDMSNMSTVSQGSDSQQMMGFSQGQQNMSFTGASPVAGPSTPSGILFDGPPHKTCQLCGKAFLTKTGLERHLRVHTGERPFKCDSCGKGFSQSGHVKRHQKTCTVRKKSSTLQ